MNLPCFLPLSLLSRRWLLLALLCTCALLLAAAPAGGAEAQLRVTARVLPIHPGHGALLAAQQQLIAGAPGAPRDQILAGGLVRMRFAPAPAESPIALAGASATATDAAGVQTTTVVMSTEPTGQEQVLVEYIAN